MLYKILAKLIPFVLGIYLCLLGLNYMFDYDGYMERKARKEKFKEELKSKKLERKGKKESENLEKKKLLFRDLVTNVKFPKPAAIEICFDRQKKNLPDCKLTYVIHIKGYEPYVIDMTIVTDVNYLQNDSLKNGLAECETDRIWRPRIRQPDINEPHNIDLINRYNALQEGKIEKVIVHLRDARDYSQIYSTKVFKEF